MIMNYVKAVAVGGALAILGGTTQAAITYVDLTDGGSGNTMMYSNGAWQAWTAFNGQTPNPNDGIWDRRAFANSATIFQNAQNGQIDTNATRLRTTIEVPAPGPHQYYNVYAFFWTDTSLTWAAGASVTDSPSPLPVYQQSTPGVTRFWAPSANVVDAPNGLYSTNLSPNPFTTPVMIAQGNRRLLMTPVLGQVYDSTITVYTGPNPNQTGSDTRTWLDGIGYELVANQILAPVILPNNDLSLTYSGAAGRQYTWEWTDSLEPPIMWTPLQTSVANASGLISLTVTPTNFQASYRVHDVTPPPVPVTNLTATAGDTQVSLSWSASAFATSYNVKRATSSGGPYTTVTNVTTISFVDTGLVNETTYYYVVSALNFNGESSDSPQASATPLPPQPPAAPTELAAAAGNNLVLLNWSASIGATSYNVKRATSSGGPYTTVTNVTATSFVDTDLDNGTTYYFVVSALNPYGESPDSSEADATPDTVPPFVPAGLTAVPGNAQVSLSWSASPGAESYNVKRATVSGGPHTTVANVTETGFVDTDLDNGTTYYYVVSAVNPYGESADSTEKKGTPFDTPPLVYSVEFTGAGFPAPPLPTLGNLPFIQALPDPFAWADDPLNLGDTRSTSFYDWSHRRAEMKAQIENYEIGPKPAVDPAMVFASYTPTTATNGTLTVIVTNVVFGTNRTLTINSAITLPAGEGPFPALIGMDSQNGSIPLNMLTSRNIARITFTSNQVTANGNHQNTNPYYQLYQELGLNVGNTGQYSAWAWGVSRIIDGLEKVQDVLPINLERLAVSGCSYAGKMALFAGALDERVALTIAIESGGGGANSWRYNQTEPDGSVEKINNTNYDWFANQMQQFSSANVSYLPEDHHLLMALVAPRGLFVTGNVGYLWLGNPSHYVACRATERVYDTFGISDRFGFNIIGGYDHCALGAAGAAAVRDDLGPFLDKFLLGDTNPDTTIRTYNSSYSSINYAAWTAWWGTTTNAVVGGQ